LNAAGAGAAHLEVAREERTTRYQVARAFQDAGDLQLAQRDRTPARRLWLDEVAHRRGHELATVVSDLDRRRVVEVLDGRSRRVVEHYLRALTKGERGAIEVVSIDPYDAYRQAIKAVLPHARIVTDPFHLVRGANTALDAVRRDRQRLIRVGKATQGHAPRRQGRLARRSLPRPTPTAGARERLSEGQRRQLCELFAHEPLIAEAWGLKEAFRAIYRAPTASPRRATSRLRSPTCPRSRASPG
jgi:transposase